MERYADGLFILPGQTRGATTRQPVYCNHIALTISTKDMAYRGAADKPVIRWRS